MGEYTLRDKWCVWFTGTVTIMIYTMLTLRGCEMQKDVSALRETFESAEVVRVELQEKKCKECGRIYYAE